LPGENLIVIALIGSPSLAFDGISLLCSRGGEFTERTPVLTGVPASRGRLFLLLG
jgi:hypothetical protein